MENINKLKDATDLSIRLTKADIERAEKIEKVFLVTGTALWVTVGIIAVANTIKYIREEL